MWGAVRDEESELLGPGSVVDGGLQMTEMSVSVRCLSREYGNRHLNRHLE